MSDRHAFIDSAIAAARKMLPAWYPELAEFGDLPNVRGEVYTSAAGERKAAVVFASPICIGKLGYEVFVMVGESDIEEALHAE